MTDTEKASQFFFEGLDYFDAGDYAAAKNRLMEAYELVPDKPSILNNLAGCLIKLGEYEEAAQFVNKALEIDSQDPVGLAHNILLVEHQAYLLQGKERHFEAIQLLKKAIEIDPHNPEAWESLANGQFNMEQYEECVASIKKAANFGSKNSEILSIRMHALQQICNWDMFFEQVYEITKRNIDKCRTINAFYNLSLPITGDLLKKSAIHYSNQFTQAEKIDKTSPVAGQNKRLHIGYFSSDMRSHPVAHLIVGMLEYHNKEKFEISAFSFGPKSNDKTTQRLRNAFDRFIVIDDISDERTAEMARELGVDIAVDLNGYTKFCRPKIFSNAPAPVIVNMLGFPGTMGTEHHDYIIGDDTLIPEKQRCWYSEKIAYMPFTYQMNDSLRPISPIAMTKREHGLPEKGFVFCCFNQAYKISPDVFDIWMRLLSQIEDSVLWLLKCNEAAMENLRKEARKRGIAGDRIVFADKVPLDEHLARHKLADLFLDTFYYNAHTTCSDALWAELPVITRLGNTMAGRVAASLLKAAGMDDLITNTSSDYEALALELAENPEKLAKIKSRLASKRSSCPLFNTELFTRHLEILYSKMFERSMEGLEPAHLHLSTDEIKNGEVTIPVS